jgi:ABC-type bacteriocin/lantibiotic exporter with double-glycine peptidase domain
MTSNDGETRIYVNWGRLRPTTVQGWLRLVAGILLAVCILVLVAAVASTLLVIALIAATLSGAWWMLSRLFRGRNQTLIASRNDQDA